MLVTFEVSQSVMVPLKEEAPWNMVLMPVTFEVSQSRGWLKAMARLNMLFMLVTEETFQVERGWLKEEAKKNMRFMSVTFEVSQLVMLPLKEEAP